MRRYRLLARRMSLHWNFIRKFMQCGENCEPRKQRSCSWFVLLTWAIWGLKPVWSLSLWGRLGDGTLRVLLWESLLEDQIWICSYWKVASLSWDYYVWGVLYFSVKMILLEPWLWNGRLLFPGDTVGHYLNVIGFVHCTHGLVPNSLQAADFWVGWWCAIKLVLVLSGHLDKGGSGPHLGPQLLQRCPPPHCNCVPPPGCWLSSLLSFFLALKSWAFAKCVQSKIISTWPHV